MRPKNSEMLAAWQASAAYHASTFFEVEAIEETPVERPPGRGPEAQVPVHLLFGRFGFRRRPTTGLGPQPTRMGVERFELAELPAAGQLDCEGEIWQASALRAGLEHANHLRRHK